MKKNWYFSILITAFALLIAIQQQEEVNNQEIVLEFLNNDVTTKEAQKTLAKVAQQLQSIGAKNTKLIKGKKEGEFRITYHSDTDVSVIKKLLNKDQLFALDLSQKGESQNQTNTPKEEQAKKYNVNVYEIQNSPDFGSDYIHGYVLAQQQELDQNAIPSNFTSANVNIADYYHFDEVLPRLQRTYYTIAIAIEATAHNIAEVRAGPLS